METVLVIVPARMSNRFLENVGSNSLGFACQTAFIVTTHSGTTTGKQPQTTLKGTGMAVFQQNIIRKTRATPRFGPQK